jgi:hypothetical protein
MKRIMEVNNMQYTKKMLIFIFVTILAGGMIAPPAYANVEKDTTVRIIQNAAVDLNSIDHVSIGNSKLFAWNVSSDGRSLDGIAADGGSIGGGGPEDEESMVSSTRP